MFCIQKKSIHFLCREIIKLHRVSKGSKVSHQKCLAGKSKLIILAIIEIAEYKPRVAIYWCDYGGRSCVFG